MSSAASAAARMAARALLLGGRSAWTAGPATTAAAQRPSTPAGASASFASSSSPSSSSSSSAPPSSSQPHDEPLHEHLGGLEHIDVDVDRAAGVATLRLNRPKQLNALSSEVCEEVVDVALRLDADRGVRALVVTGAPPPPPPPQPSTTTTTSSSFSGQGASDADSTKKKPPRPVFAAGADIREMATMAATEAREGRLYQGWRRLAAVRMPLVAAVNGVALGGGFELAMMCDVVIASEDAEFGLPEPTLGVIPLMGGTQRLARLAGRAVAMDVALTGRRLSAREALQWGIVSRIVPADKQLGQEAVVLEAQAAALKIARLPARSMEAAKRAVAFAADGDGGLMAGLDLEERLFHECFETKDRVEGMAAFLERRAPQWTHS